MEMCARSGSLWSTEKNFIPLDRGRFVVVNHVQLSPYAATGRLHNSQTQKTAKGDRITDQDER